MDFQNKYKLRTEALECQEKVMIVNVDTTTPFYQCLRRQNDVINAIARG